MILKNIFLLLSFCCILSHTTNAQIQTDYEGKWKKVKTLEDQGLTSSAYKEAVQIYKLAKAEKQDAQQILACMYQLKYNTILKDESEQSNIFFVDSLIAEASFPARNILQSMQAEMFQQFLQYHRYRFYGRTKLQKEDSKDIKTWSIDKLHQQISTLYQASLTNLTLLKQTNLDGIEPILIKGKNSRHLRPTLFDFLAHRALDYFMNDERMITQPADHFSITGNNPFLPAADFVQTSFKSSDTVSLHYKALVLLQQIIAFHLQDKKPDALIDADIKRLNFVHQFAVNENKNALFEKALQQLESNFPNNSLTAQATYLRAKIYYDQGQDFDPLTKITFQFSVRKAKEICEAVLAKFPQSEGGINCSNLITEILRPLLSIESEKVNLPDQPFRSLLKFKNAGTVYFRLIKINRQSLTQLNQADYQLKWNQIIGMSSIKSWNITLPNPNDFQNHSAEIKIDALDKGSYLLLAGLDQNFSLINNIVCKQLLYVSNISYINQANAYYILHRQTGQPLAGCKVQLWNTNYYNNQPSENQPSEKFTTDKNGAFHISPSAKYHTFNVQINYQDDELFMDEYNYNEIYNSYQQPNNPVSFLFTDRAIYRPGQVLYFKGIVLKKPAAEKKSSLLTSFTSNVQLLDANGQKIAALKLTTNEFGSYHGSFKIPEGLLNGQFSLYDSSTTAFHYINVEEYKRPKFSTTINIPEGSYRVNDRITVTGAAIAFAGNAIDAANVKYRVVRKVHYPIWQRRGGIYQRESFSRYPIYNNQEVEIANGETTTDTKGSFQIAFKALPDESIAKKDQPIFYFEVNADVTDINGETRSGSALIKVAYQSLQLNLDIPERMPVDSFNNIFIRSSNLNDLDVVAFTQLSIQELKSPDKIFRERYWQQPDLFLMDQATYYEAFPTDVYNNENEVAHYEKGKIILEKTDSSNRNWGINNHQLNAGWYRISASCMDNYGEVVKLEKYIYLSSSNQNTLNEKSPFSISVNNRITEPGSLIRFQYQTCFKKVWLIETQVKMYEEPSTNFKTIEREKFDETEIPINENDRGGLAINYIFIKNNRIFKGAEQIEIPWSNKDLHISYETFRDKVLSGSHEKWTVKISGSKGEQIAAELLAGMYDASLDAFRKQEWSALQIWPGLSNTVSWVAHGFNAAVSEEHNTYQIKYTSPEEKAYDRLGVWNDQNLYDQMVIQDNPVHMKLPKPENDKAGIITLRGLNANAVSLAVADSTDNNNKFKDGETVSPKQNNEIKIRTNFNETAFFYPDLKTDEEGNVSFSTTLPDALTSWKLMTFAHTKNLASAYSEKLLMTQKPLMVQPNTPRFFREGDLVDFNVKMVNLDSNFLSGKITLDLIDAQTNLPVNTLFNNQQSTQYFTTWPGQSQSVKFPISIPQNFNSTVLYRVKAIAIIPNYQTGESFSDGEEMAIPVLTNRTLVTETMPINLRGTNNKEFKFDKLLQSTPTKNNSISNHAVTVEYSSNPAWYAVQALPYLMEYPYECAEQTFNRYYANTLATHISNNIPQLKNVFAKWMADTSNKLISNLEKNEELKSILLQETPWVLDAKNETQQKKNIAMLFDMLRMNKEQLKDLQKLKEMQNNSGGFVWFKGGPDDRYITQYILTGIGHLNKLKALAGGKDELMQIAVKALLYLDDMIGEDYKYLIKHKSNLNNNNLTNTIIQYLYMRSFFPERAINNSAKIAFDYFNKQSRQYWLQNGKYLQAMIALSQFRNKDLKTSKAIIQSLKENAIHHAEMGMYWKEWNTGGYYWHQSSIESQAMMIEAFMEIDKNKQLADELKTWLLKQKQTQNWKTTRATAEACYALLLSGSNWLADEKIVTIALGNKTINSGNFETSAGTGYFKKRFEAAEVQPEMGNITVKILSNNNSNSSWGNVYWQYFQDLDKITNSSNPLQLDKKLYVEKNSNRGPELVEVSNNDNLMVGDKVKVRIELRVDRDMEYVHMKDMRASCMEPVNVISAYKYQGGLGYYESTNDASTNFFFSYLSRGTYVFEYPLFISQAGNFSNGITSIQCMYAPEFSSHSNGIRINATSKAVKTD